MAQSFEQCDMDLRTALFEYHKNEGDFASAAHALAGIALENSPRAWNSVEEKANAVADHYVKVAEIFNRKRHIVPILRTFSLFFSFSFQVAEETVDAENYVNKANGFMNDGIFYPRLLSLRIVTIVIILSLQLQTTGFVSATRCNTAASWIQTGNSTRLRLHITRYRKPRHPRLRPTTFWSSWARQQHALSSERYFCELKHCL
jgi:hypothetical protein